MSPWMLYVLVPAHRSPVPVSPVRVVCRCIVGSGCPGTVQQSGSSGQLERTVGHRSLVALERQVEGSFHRSPRVDRHLAHSFQRPAYTQQHHQQLEIGPDGSALEFKADPRRYSTALAATRRLGPRENGRGHTHDDAHRLHRPRLTAA
eukprot:2935165-Rhodomonas_salina.2